MIHSMTAFAEKNINNTFGHIIWELRSINQRYFEIFIRLPEQFRNLEPIIYERLRKKITRGKIECNLRFESNEKKINKLSLNIKLIEQLIQAIKVIQQYAGQNEINLFDILHWPGVIFIEEQSLDVINSYLLTEFELTLDILINNRKIEGEILSIFIKQKINDLYKEIQNIRNQMPEIIKWQYEKLKIKLSEIKIKLDSNRLEQELIILIQKIDITEELDRLETNINIFIDVFDKQEVVGKHLDFIIQECNREANTLASKSISNKITHSAIKLKVLIEQIREQIQNIE